MLLNAKEYEQRLEGYSKSTLQLIMDMNSISKEVALKLLEITTNPELSEEQVVEQLKELKTRYKK